MHKFDVVTVGNAIIDLFLGIHNASVSCRLNKETRELCIRSGEKIELDQMDRCIGGNATNASVGMSRLGFSTGLIAEVGDDEFAQLIFRTLESEHVDTSRVLKTKGAASSMTVGINFQAERTLFVEHVKRKHDFVFEDIQTSWVYLTSLGNEWKTAYERVVDFTSKNNVKIAFNPGTIQIQAGHDAIAEVLKLTDILFVNKQEAEKLSTTGTTSTTSITGGGDIKELLMGLQGVGPKVVVVTDGKEGSYAIDEDGVMYSLGLFPASVLERTGAGDAYASGFLSAIIQGEKVPQAMRWGTANAAGVITKVGAQAGLLNTEQMEEMLKKYDSIQAKTL